MGFRATETQYEGYFFGLVDREAHPIVPHIAFSFFAWDQCRVISFWIFHHFKY
jgi:hypothetical protein